MIDFVGYGNRLAAVVDECVGAGGLVGVYVHGSASWADSGPSAAMSTCLSWSRSPVPPDRQAALGAALLAAAYPCPGIGLELSVVPRPRLVTAILAERVPLEHAVHHM